MWVRLGNVVYAPPIRAVDEWPIVDSKGVSITSSLWNSQLVICKDKEIYDLTIGRQNLIVQ
ncbi:hypothetical protein OIU84_016170, partial [Salix udensis]